MRPKGYKELESIEQQAQQTQIIEKFGKRMYVKRATRRVFRKAKAGAVRPDKETSDSSVPAVSSSGEADSVSHTLVRAVIFLPHNRSYLFSMEHTLPGIQVAITYVRRHILRNVTFAVTYRDSGCNGRDAPVFLFNLFSTNSVDVVFGPVCDYALAPVGRYAPVWNLPVLTSGGFAHDFGQKQEEFSTLTRLGQNFEDLAEFLLDILARFVWNTSHLIYDAKGRDDIIEGFCFLAASAMIQKSKERRVTNAFHMYDTNTIEELLVQKVGLQFGVKAACSPTSTAALSEELVIS
ncbi:hypothetical protein ACOMHN_038711 [Nucella lapillus]